MTVPVPFLRCYTSAITDTDVIAAAVGTLA